MSLVPVGLGGKQAYEIDRSLRFRRANSAVLSRTPSATGNRRQWTWSGWVKRGDLTADATLIGTAEGVGTFSWNVDSFRFLASGALRFVSQTGANVRIQVDTTALFLDPSEWYHIVLTIDTTQATSTLGARIWVNNVLQPVTTTFWTQNQDTFITNNQVQYIGRWSSITPSHYYDGFIAEVILADNQLLTPSAFGQVDTVTGEWVPKKYTGTFGISGYYLPFNDGSSLGNLGLDRSGLGNNWNLNNFSITNNITYDWAEDTPTDNVPTLNALQLIGSTAQHVQDANLSYREASGVAAWKSRLASTAIPLTGKWYAEFAVTYSGTNPYNSGTTACLIGLHDGNPASTYPGQTSGTYGYGSAGTNYHNATPTAGFGSWPTNCVVMVAYDADLGRLWFGVNGVWVAGGNPAANLNPVYTGITGEKFFAVGSWWISPDGTMWVYPNFGGHRPFTYGPPAGFRRLSRKRLPNPVIVRSSNHFDTKLRTGTGATVVVSGMRFEPDLLWTKSRSVGGANNYHNLTDRVRGILSGGSPILNTSSTAAETTFSGFGVVDTNPDGYQIDGNGSLTNASPTTYVDWLWKAGGAPVANNVGSIASQVSANVLGGVSLGTFNFHAGVAGTIGHGLGVPPELIIVKSRNNAVRDWVVYNKDLGPTNYILFNTTAAYLTSATVWNNTAPTSSVFSLGSGFSTANYGTLGLFYAFASIPGFSKITFFTGNNNINGPFVYCGFRPRWILVKNASGVSDWTIWDSDRNPINRRRTWLVTNQNTAEGSNASIGVDFLANGFKIRTDSGFNPNVNANNYIVMAFAESPFKYSRAV